MDIEKNVFYIHKRILLSCNKNEITKFAGKWKGLETIIVNELIMTRKTYCMCSLTCVWGLGFVVYMYACINADMDVGTGHETRRDTMREVCKEMINTCDIEADRWLLGLGGLRGARGWG